MNRVAILLIEHESVIPYLFSDLATNPLHQETDDDGLDYITRFCDQVNKEFDGAHDGVQLLVHKITSPQEKEALLGLTVSQKLGFSFGSKYWNFKN